MFQIRASMNYKNINFFCFPQTTVDLFKTCKQTKHADYILL